MPYTIQGNSQYTTSSDLSTYSYDYEYPDGLDLKPGSKLHEFIKDEVLERARISDTVMKRRHSSWNEIDATLTAYIEADEAEKDVLEGDARKPVSIVFPYSYAVHETLLTYMVQAFLQDPIFRYEGTGPEDIIGATMLELVIQNQCIKTKVALSLHTFFRDALGYGVAYAAPTWVQKWGRKTVKQESTGLFDFLGRVISGTPVQRVETDALLFEGNALRNIDPYYALPDPNVPIQDIQEGEFFGWVEHTSFSALLSEEQYNEDLFNVKYVRHVQQKKSQYGSKDRHKREERHGGAIEQNSNDKKTTPTDVIRMEILLIPRDWKLGDSEYPEKWTFAVANDAVVIQAQPSNFNHNQYGVITAAPEFDGYTSTPLSRLEILYGMQTVINWLFNSHVTNVRKAINDMFLIDPYLVNVKDLKDPKAGKLIRLRRPAWGRGVKDVATQFPVNDVTRQHIADAGWIVQFMNTISGSDESMMGSLRSGGPERLTKGEFQGTRAGAISRLERIARVVGLQAMQDLGYQFASNCQQLMDEDLYVKMSGMWQEKLMRDRGIQAPNGRINVTPFDILVDYDVNVRDGSVPGSNFSEFWIQAFNIIMSNPEMAQQFDTTRLFMYIARNMGAKSVEDFIRKEPVQTNTQVMADEQVQQQVDRGNLVPFKAPAGGF